MKEKNDKEVEHKTYMPFVRLANDERPLHVVSETDWFSSEQMKIQYKNAIQKAHLSIQKNDIDDENRVSRFLSNKMLTDLVNRINYTKLTLEEEDSDVNYK